MRYINSRFTLHLHTDRCHQKHYDAASWVEKKTKDVISKIQFESSRTQSSGQGSSLFETLWEMKSFNNAWNDLRFEFSHVSGQEAHRSEAVVTPLEVSQGHLWRHQSKARIYTTSYSGILLCSNNRAFVKLSPLTTGCRSLMHSFCEYRHESYIAEN